MGNSDTVLREHYINRLVSRDEAASVPAYPRRGGEAALPDCKIERYKIGC